jgi:hypothetical protein
MPIVTKEAFLGYIQNNPDFNLYFVNKPIEVIYNQGSKGNPEPSPKETFVIGRIYEDDTDIVLASLFGKRASYAVIINKQEGTFEFTYDYEGEEIGEFLVQVLSLRILF